MTHNNDKNDGKDRMQPCPFCNGTGKVHGKPADDTEITGSDKHEGKCPVCQGRGKIRGSLRPVRLRVWRWLKRKLPNIPKPGRGGRLSRSSIILPPPGSPLAGWSEGNLVPRSSPESAFISAEIDYNTMDDNNPVEAHPGQTLLRISDNITNILGREYPPNLVLDTDSTETNFDNALEPGSNPVTAQVVYTDGGNDYDNVLLRETQPYIIQQDDEYYVLSENTNYSVELVEAQMAVNNTPLLYDIQNEPVPELSLLSHQPPSVTFTEVLAPDPYRQINSYDVTGTEDQTGFNINTDITGHEIF